MQRRPLPADYVDRPRYQRWWVNVLVLLHRKQVKAVCCETFRITGEHACKGCPTLYDTNSNRWTYRWIARVAKRRT